MSLGVSEKKAISDQEAKPEKSKRIVAKVIAKMAPAVGAMIVTSLNIC
jgi:hypothetical protein